MATWDLTVRCLYKYRYGCERFVAIIGPSAPWGPGEVFVLLFISRGTFVHNFKVFFIYKYIKIIFFYFLKIIFNNNPLKSSKIIKKIF